MATDNTQSPSDAELWAAIDRYAAATAGKQAGCIGEDIVDAAHTKMVDVVTRWGAPATVGDPVAWGIFDSQGFYESAHDEESAARFCAYYNKRRGSDPRRPYTYQALVPRAAPPTPSRKMPDLTALTERGKEAPGEGRVPLTPEQITELIGTQRSHPLWIVVEAMVRKVEEHHGITSKEGGPNADT